MLVRLESIGAAVEPERPGLVCFDVRGLLRLHGGLEGVLAAARRSLRTPARYGVAPSRFAAVAAATRARVRRPVIVSAGRKQAGGFLAPLPVALLRARPALADLPEALERLGIGTLGELAALAPAALADRFGTAGLHAHELASGGDGALRPRPASEFLREALELPEAASGMQLERALGLLIDRLLARRERRGRTLRAVVLSAVLVEQGGTWREQVVFREALADPVRMRLALAPRLALMPAPAQQLRLAVERFGPLASDQRSLLDDPVVARTARLREAIRQTRAAAGPDAALRVLEVDPESRFPERRAVLTPFEGSAMSGPRRLSVPRRVAVEPATEGRPLIVDGRDVDSVRESWLVEDRWWTDRPLRRRYWEVVTTCGRDEVVFHDLEKGRWWRQR